MQVKDLSKEVQLLFMMTGTVMYEGFEYLNNVIKLGDAIKNGGNDLCAVIAKVFVYEQIAEQMVKSLYEQDILWKKVKYKDIDYNEKNNDDYHNRIEKMGNLIDFQRVNELKEYCEELRNVRDQFAHDLVKYKVDELLNNYKYLDGLYEKVYDIYSSQNSTFVERISQKLKSPIDFLICGKSYATDIAVIRGEALQIKAKKNKTYEEWKNLANLHQIFWLLKEWNDIGSTEIKLGLKEELLGPGFCEFAPVEEWNF